MNYKLEAVKLTEMRRQRLEKIRILQDEVRALSTQIANVSKEYKRLNKRSDESSQILSGFNKENIRDILRFMLPALADGDEAYRKAYKNVDMAELLMHDEFFDFVIITFGRPIIETLKKYIIGVEIHEGEECLKMLKKDPQRVNNNKRLGKKLTRGAIVKEAKRIASNISQNSLTVEV